MAVVIIFLIQNIWWFLSRPTFSNISKNEEHSCAKIPRQLIERFMNLTCLKLLPNNNNNNNNNNNENFINITFLGIYNCKSQF